MRKLLFAILAIACFIMPLSCKSESGEVNEDLEIDCADDYIFDVNTEINVVYEKESNDSSRVVQRLFDIFGYFPTRGVYSEIEKYEHEILIGYTDRELSSIAYKQLERLRSDEKDVVGYLIYSDGKSIAIAYDDDEYEIGGALTCAVDYLLNDIIGDKTSLVLKKGMIHKNMFNIIDYQEEIDDKMLDGKWLEFRAYLETVTDNGDDIVDAIKHYYDSVCTDNVVSWFANLYDPVTGGFYYSNSARNTIGFLPDAESTSQALNFLKSSGMTEDVNRNIAEAIPEWMKNQIICFLKSLQDPKTGYFYHPQWTVDSVNSNVSRRSRDMNQATGILEALGSAPTYNAPNGAKGDGILPDGTTADSTEPISSQSALTHKMNASVPVAVSKVKSSSAAVAAHLVSDVTFKAYLDNLQERTKLPQSDSRYRSFYSIGNTLSAQLNEIKDRDEQLKSKGENYSLGAILVDWLTKNQNKETGLWGDL